jgi:hypothetical protein
MLQSRHIILSVCLLNFGEWWVPMILHYKKRFNVQFKICFIQRTLNNTLKMKKESRMRDKIRNK